MKAQLPILTLFHKPETQDFLHPWDNAEMLQWSKKLGITEKQLHDAVLDTGSLMIKDIRSYLKDKGVLFSFKKLWQNIQLAAFLY